MTSPPDTPATVSRDLPNDLIEFKRRNPESEISRKDGKLHVERLWGDENVNLKFSETDSALLATLTGTRFPPRLSALFRQEERLLEFILPRTFVHTDLIPGRAFSFKFRGSTLQCSFDSPTPSLRQLASALAIRYVASPERRGLATLKFRLRRDERRERHEPFAQSFIVRGVTCVEADLPELVRHLNFYMSFYDRRSPVLPIHEEPETRSSTAALPSLRLDSFPSDIRARPLNPYLLALWETAKTAPDVVRRYLYSYQIVEYAAFYYLRDDLARSIARVLSEPHLHDRVDDATRQVLELVAEDRTSDDAKMVAVINQCVSPSLLWAEIAPRRDFFSIPTEFEGGFTVPELVRAGWGLDDFTTMWTPKLPDALRKIRNALVHAREQRLSKTMAPSRRNRQLLIPWTDIMFQVASLVALNEEG